MANSKEDLASVTDHSIPGNLHQPLKSLTTKHRQGKPKWKRNSTIVMVLAFLIVAVVQTALPTRFGRQWVNDDVQTISHRVDRIMARTPLIGESHGHSSSAFGR